MIDDLPCYAMRRHADIQCTTREPAMSWNSQSGNFRANDKQAWVLQTKRQANRLISIAKEIQDNVFI